MDPEISISTHWIEETASTNSYLKSHEEIPSLCIVATHSQTAGRGQRGNTWEAEPDKNLTFSLKFKPEGIAPSSQFVISEAVALAMVKGLANFDIKASLKWPNDIYVGDKKICGILIENTILGTAIETSIVGIGLNINQKVFLSNAPNPVSMTLITGMEYDLKEALSIFTKSLEKEIRRLKKGEAAEIHEEYLSVLWRGDGKDYPFRDAASGEEFMAIIDSIEPTGHLHLYLPDKSTRRYAFKEVEFLLPASDNSTGK